MLPPLYSRKCRGKLLSSARPWHTNTHATIVRKGLSVHANHTDTSEVSILNRILRPNSPAFSPEAARDILTLDFDQSDKDRMRELSAKARAGTLTAKEDAEAGKYELIGHLLNIMQSKARRSLKGRRDDNGKKPPRTH
jgi:hypothetical protein